MPKDERGTPWTHEERVMRRTLDCASACHWEARENGRKIVFESPLRVNEMSELMMRRTPAGYALGAKLFHQRAVFKNMERAVCSHLLTRLACAMHDNNGSRQPITESEVAVFGHFVAELMGEFPERIISWAEDMNADDPENDLSVQPTALIRGVFLSSPVTQNKKVGRFWDLAVSALKFPLRIFSDPCEPRHRAMFAPFHLKAFGLIFGAVSLETVERLVGQMRQHAKIKLVLKWVQEEKDGDGVWHLTEPPVSESERQRTFEAIVAEIAGAERRQEVSEMFGLGKA